MCILKGRPAKTACDSTPTRRLSHRLVAPSIRRTILHAFAYVTLLGLGVYNSYSWTSEHQRPCVMPPKVWLVPTLVQPYPGILPEACLLETSLSLSNLRSRSGGRLTMLHGVVGCPLVSGILPLSHTDSGRGAWVHPSIEALVQSLCCHVIVAHKRSRTSCKSCFWTVNMKAAPATYRAEERHDDYDSAASFLGSEAVCRARAPRHQIMPDFLRSRIMLA
jgi:hypothetical protein